MKETRLNASKRLPIVFCLDVSPSMGWCKDGNSTSIDLLNVAVNNFINELKLHTKARAAAEIAFVTFGEEIVMNTEFTPLSALQTMQFKTEKVGATSISKAVFEAIKKIKDRRELLKEGEISCYAPFLVLVTDGDPDSIVDSEAVFQQTLKEVRSHCHDHIPVYDLIVPFVIGVGDYVDTKTLNAYSEGFTKGFFHIKGKSSDIKLNLNKVFQMIINSTIISFTPNKSAKEIISTIQNDANDLLADLAGE